MIAQPLPIKKFHLDPKEGLSKEATETMSAMVGDPEKTVRSKREEKEARGRALGWEMGLVEFVENFAEIKKDEVEEKTKKTAEEKGKEAPAAWERQYLFDEDPNFPHNSVLDSQDFDWDSIDFGSVPNDVAEEFPIPDFLR